MDEKLCCSINSETHEIAISLYLKHSYNYHIRTYGIWTLWQCLSCASSNCGQLSSVVENWNLHCFAWKTCFIEYFTIPFSELLCWTEFEPVCLWSVSVVWEIMGWPVRTCRSQSEMRLADHPMDIPVSYSSTGRPYSGHNERSVPPPEIPPRSPVRHPISANSAPVPEPIHPPPDNGSLPGTV